MMSWSNPGENLTDLQNKGPTGVKMKSASSKTHHGVGENKERDVQILDFIEVLSQDGVSKLKWPAEMVKYTITKPSVSFSSNLLQCNLMRLLRLQPHVQPKMESGEMVYADCTDRRDIQPRPTLHTSQGSYFSNSQGSHHPSSHQKRSWDSSCSSECDDDECCLPSRKVRPTSKSYSRSQSIPTYTSIGYYDDCHPSLHRSWSRSRSRSRSRSNPKYACTKKDENYNPPSRRFQSMSRSYSRSRSFSRSRSQSRSRTKTNYACSKYDDDCRRLSSKFKSQSRSHSRSRSPGVRSRSRSISTFKAKYDGGCRQPSHRFQSRSHSDSRSTSPRSRFHPKSRSYNRSRSPTPSKPKYDYKEYDDGDSRSEGSPRYYRYWSHTYGRYRWSRVHSSSSDDSTRSPLRSHRSRTRSKSKDKESQQPSASTAPGNAPPISGNMAPLGPHFIPLNTQPNLGQPIHLQTGQPIMLTTPMHQVQMMSAHFAQQQGTGPLPQQAMNPAQAQQAHVQQAHVQQAHAQQAHVQQAHVQQAHAAAANTAGPGGQPQMVHLPLHAHLAAQSAFSPVTMTSIQSMQTIHVTHGLPIPGLAPMPPVLPPMPHPMAMQMPGMPMLFR